jgi:cytochrome c oxidase subunit 3
VYEPKLEHHFEDLPGQRHAARLGIWIFLGSELLFFAALFTLYAFYRGMHPEVFAEGVRHNSRILGTLNTIVLIGGSLCAALAVNLLRADRRKPAVLLCTLAGCSALIFLVIKSVEYAAHFREGIHPGGVGHFFVEQPEQAYGVFFTLYFAMTGLHGIHVIIGAVLLFGAAVWMKRRNVGAAGAYRLEIVALYWHFVDTVWIFLWPMFYLMGQA